MTTGKCDFSSVWALLLVTTAMAVLVFPLNAVGDVSKVSSTKHDYLDALNKAILFFEGMRSGKLPAERRVTWRKDSGLQDGQDVGVDLVGGYYDAGDNVKFGFPLAYTTTILAWSMIEFGQDLGQEVSHARDALWWSTDYLLKATSKENTVYVQVGDPYNDHNCWERPEDMDTARTVYQVNTTAPGSEVAAETAAALAAASIVFRSYSSSYADYLLERSKSLTAWHCVACVGLPVRQYLQGFLQREPWQMGVGALIPIVGALIPIVSALIPIVGARSEL